MAVIDRLERHKGKTWVVELSCGECFYLGENIVFDFHLKKGMELDEEEVCEIKRADLWRKAKERALYLLDYRDYSFADMYGKLEQTYDEDIAMEVTRELAKMGLIDDERYAKTLAGRLLLDKKYGLYRARREMQLKGIAREIIDEALAEYDDSTQERLSELVEKKYAHKITDRKSLQTVTNSLLRRGYSYSEIKEVLSQYEVDD